jgi:hypothetical protein
VPSSPAPARTYFQRNARTAVESLKTEMAVWGLLEVREGGSPAGVEVLLEEAPSAIDELLTLLVGIT